MVSIDGLLPAAYTDPETQGLKIPTLRRLKSEGVWARGVVGVLPSITFPAHATLLTGVPPRVHGLTTNLVFDPLDRSAGAWNWFASAIRSKTLVAAVRERGGKTATVSWPAGIGLGADQDLVEIWRPGSQHKV